MKQPIRKSTIERLCDRIAQGPTPAGVSVAAISASFALGLLMMALDVTARRADIVVDRRRASRLRNAARGVWATLMNLADEDVAAFDAYLESRRLPRGNSGETAKRKRALASSLRRATQVPLRVARTAALGLRLCADAAEFVYRGVAPDLDAAIMTLGASARIAIASARSNIERLDRESAYHAKALAEADRIERETLGLLDRVLTGTSSAVQRRR